MPLAGRHAVVVGGSMAGMLAARVLTDHFERVTVLERDLLPDAPAPRKGLPQARHLHILLMRGQLAFEHLFPGLIEELVADYLPRVSKLLVIGWRASGLTGLR